MRLIPTLCLVLLSASLLFGKDAPAPHHRATWSATAARDSHGKIKRSNAARKSFMKQTGYPHGRPGYVIDHIIPLKRGGKDEPANMQWQTIEAAKLKDSTE